MMLPGPIDGSKTDSRLVVIVLAKLDFFVSALLMLLWSTSLGRLELPALRDLEAAQLSKLYLRVGM